MIKGNVQHTAKFAISVAVKIILNLSAKPKLSQIGKKILSLESVASVAITKKSTVWNTVKKNLVSQTQTQVELKI